MAVTFQTTAFCIHCGRKQRFHIRSTDVSIQIRGDDIHYSEKSAYCAVCGEELYVPRLNDVNAHARIKACAEQRGITL